MSDLIERLRRGGRFRHLSDVVKDAEEAADEIERLTGELIRMRQHCHKISAEMSDKAARDRIAKLDAVAVAAQIAYNTLAELPTYPKGQNELHDALKELYKDKPDG